MSKALAGLTPVIVGYGRAGRDLHHASLRHLAGHPEVIAVDPRPTAVSREVTWLPTLDAALDRVDLDRAVFHVTTPVADHLAVVELLATAGARHVVLEKPIAATAAQARTIAAVAGRTTVLPVGVWLSSAVTRRIEAALADGVIGELRSLRMEQMKPRFTRSAGAHDAAVATEVELPHQLLLALHLGGGPGELADTITWGMPLPGGGVLPGAGGVDVTLRQPNRVTTRLMSDLTCPVRLRRLRVTGTRGTLVAHFPISSDDHTGQVILPGRDRELVRDLPLTQFLAAAYGHFAGRREPPPGDLALHVRVAELVEEATFRARNADETGVAA
jgi:predicted dehydrogenase